MENMVLQHPDSGYHSNYYYEKSLTANETVIINFPAKASAAHGAAKIGYVCDDSVLLYATIAVDPATTLQWQSVAIGKDINLCATAIKVVNGAGATTFGIRIIL